MKIKSLLFFLLLTTLARAQQTFLIYRLTGNVTLNTIKQGSVPRIGQLLKSNDKLWLDKGASLVLICEGYNAFTINKAGNHLMSGYLDSCTKEERSVTSEYFKYIWEELTEPHTTPENNRKKYMQNTGAVVRGCPGITIDPVFDTVNFREGNAIVKWKTSLPKEQISFVLYDSEKDGKLLFRSPVTKDHILLDSIKKHAGDNEEVYWNIAINGNEMCNRKFIKFWSNSDYNKFLNKIKKELQLIQDKAEYYYATAFMLERDHFIAESLVYYKKAAALQPGKKRYMEPLNETMINQSW